MKLVLFAWLCAFLYFPSTAAASGKQTPLKPLTTQQVAQMALPTIVSLTIRGSDGMPFALGSGIIMGHNVIATCAHVVQNASSITVNFKDGRSVYAWYIAGVSSDHDVAILFAPTGHIKHLLFKNISNSSEGATVVAIGSPEGFNGSISTGIISAVREFGSLKLIQTSTPISPGSSGGALCDDTGHVIGIIKGMWKEGQNLNFAVPSFYAEDLMANSSLGTLATWAAFGLMNNSDLQNISSSSYIKKIYSAGGLVLPDKASEQAAIGYDVPREDYSVWLPGDRLYFAINHPEIDHTGMYIGNGYFIHKSITTSKIVIDRVIRTDFALYLVAVRRSKEFLGDTGTFPQILDGANN